ncbi:MAG: hypothetical protein AAGF56_05460 [Pseudomonadota bacterium]
MLQDLSGGNPLVVLAVFVAVVYVLIRFGRTRGKRKHHDQK